MVGEWGRVSLSKKVWVMPFPRVPRRRLLRPSREKRPSVLKLGREKRCCFR